MSMLKEIPKPNNKKSDEQPDTTDMPELEREESATQKQEGHGLKMLTPNQILSRLPISLAQLKAGNNLERVQKLRVILYLLLTSQPYFLVVSTGKLF